MSDRDQSDSPAPPRGVEVLPACKRCGHPADAHSAIEAARLYARELECERAAAHGTPDADLAAEQGQALRCVIAEGAAAITAALLAVADAVREVRDDLRDRHVGS